MQRMNRAALVAAVLLGTSAPATALAQHGQPGLPTGEPVRLTAPSQSIMGMVGRIEGPAGDGFLFQPTDGSETLVVPYGAVTRVEVRRRHSNGGAGAVLGGLLGAAFGAVAAAASTCDPASQWCIGPSGDQLMPVAIVIFGGAGAGLGALIGSVIHSEGWRTVPFRSEEPRAGLVISPDGRRGVRVGWTLRF